MSDSGGDCLDRLDDLVRGLHNAQAEPSFWWVPEFASVKDEIARLQRVAAAAQAVILDERYYDDAGNVRGGTWFTGNNSSTRLADALRPMPEPLRFPSRFPSSTTPTPPQS